MGRDRRTLKVLAVSAYAELGGSELSIAAFLEHRPAHVEATALLVADGPLRARLGELGIPTWVGRYEGRPGVSELVRFTRALRPVLERERPDVVWATGQKAALLCAPACRAAGTPLVWHKVDFSWDAALAKPLALAVDGVISVSEAVAEAIGPLRDPRHIGVVGPPLRLPAGVRAEPDASRPTIGTLARLVPYKGHHRIVHAGALLSAEFPSLRVVLAGAPAPQYPGYEEQLRALGDELGLGSRLELPGHVEAEDVLRELSVFVNATYRDEEGFGFEGLSGAMLEASWAGIPVVATRGGGTAEGLIEGVTGTLVEEADPRLLAEAIAPYLRDPDMARRAGEAGRTFARERFAPDVASARLFELLESVAR